MGLLVASNLPVGAQLVLVCDGAGRFAYRYGFHSGNIVGPGKACFVFGDCPGNILAASLSDGPGKIPVQKKWHKIGMRIVGSRVAASALLVLALSVSAGFSAK